LSEFSNPPPKVSDSLQTMMAERYPDLVQMERHIGTSLTHAAYNSIRIRKPQREG
jgi:hypothetical protein